MKQRLLPVVAFAVVVGVVLGITRTQASTTIDQPVTSTAVKAAVTAPAATVAPTVTDRHQRKLQAMADTFGLSVEDLQKELDAEGGELTQTQKMRRGFVMKRYRSEIEKLYMHDDHEGMH